MDISEKDDRIIFPHTVILKASAGSGKTHALTKRFVQFLLSAALPHNGMKNIMAVTFSNNAAKEMKERILLWLKDIYFGDKSKVSELLQVLSMDAQALAARTASLIDEILDNYTDFHVKTIDSFMASIFKASAVDLGYNQDFEILLNGDALMEYAFELFLRKVKEGTKEGAIVENAIALLLENRHSDSPYLWEPSKSILSEIKKIYRKLAAAGKSPRTLELEKDILASRNSIKEAVAAIEDEIERSGLQRHGTSSYKHILAAVTAGNFADTLGRGSIYPPVKKPAPKDRQAAVHYVQISDMWSALTELISQYGILYAHTYYTPYIRVYEEFLDTLKKVKKHHGAVFIEDINMMLAEYLNREIVPDVYFRIGETVYHYLIDEYQDTSPIQWRNLHPLIENSISQGGSLFAVGDTKQAIYGFRDADYRIMKHQEETPPFPAASHSVRELTTNFRSLQRILDFNDTVFKHTLPKNDTLYAAAKRSGLTDFTQTVRQGNEDSGYVEVSVLQRPEIAPEDDEEPFGPEKEKFLSIVRGLILRGHGLSDIAVLASRNSDVTRAASWLNELDIAQMGIKGVPFISFSSLDIRKSKITGEIVSLLNFLDSPIDALSFATFCTGDIFAGILDRDRHEITIGEIKEFFLKTRAGSPKYKAFQARFPILWDTYFDGLFRSAGFFPLYGLVTEIYRVFKVFETIGEKEAVLARILEAIKEFEEKGSNNLRDFLALALDENSTAAEATWTIDVPTTTDAIRIMTVHKAKGLGFPVVIVLLYDEKYKAPEFIAYETKQGINLLKLNEKILKTIAVTDPGTYRLLYDEERTKDVVNRLNTLYVSLTRAKSELYVIAVEGKTGSHTSSLFQDVPVHSEGRPVVSPTEAGRDAETFQIHHHAAKPAMSAYTDESLNVLEKKRGDFIHRALFHIEYIEDGLDSVLDMAIARANSTSAFKFPAAQIKATLSGFLRSQFIGPYFTKTPGRAVKREQAFSNAAGALFIMDRVVIDPDMLTAIDFKTGSNKGDNYNYQIQGYVNLLRELYPGAAVEGIIAYVDLLEWVVIQ
ncbi:MAG: UvrD-helicase domain-containing protein [Nitrospirae bacterium]|nr:UvrD-helicase domain-containing protein [Nitrospirota bacterium]